MNEYGSDFDPYGDPPNGGPPPVRVQVMVVLAALLLLCYFSGLLGLVAP